MGRITDTLNRITRDGEDGIIQLYELFHSINDYEIPIIRFTIFPGSSLIRQRINKKGTVFTRVSELSYPPPSVTPMERANLPGNPLFYACSFPSEINEEAPLPRLISLEETSAFMKDKSNYGIERATVSRWDVINQLDLIALPFVGTYQRACPDLKRVKEGWEEALTQGIVPADALELVSYMAQEIAKEFNDRQQYFKIANFVNYLLRMNEKTKDADGIIYPSVPALGAGFNVAIKPEVTDKKIQFSNASICHFVKRGENMTVFTISDAIVDEFGSIDYKDRVISKSEAAFYREKSQGLPFVN